MKKTMPENVKIGNFEIKFHKNGADVSIATPEKLNADITGIKVKNTTPKKRR